MIRINLIKTKMGNRGAGQDQVTMMATELGSTSTGSGANAELIKKVGVMLALTVLLVVYEQYNIGGLTDQFSQVQQQQQSLQAELVQKQELAEKASTAQNQLQIIEKKISVLKELGTARVRELKALDFIQSIIPDQVWLKNINYPGGKFIFSGFAVTDDDLNDFLQRIESRSYFKDVILLQSKESKLNKGTVKEFEISAGLETR